MRPRAKTHHRVWNKIDRLEPENHEAIVQKAEGAAMSWRSPP